MKKKLFLLEFLIGLSILFTLDLRWFLLYFLFLFLTIPYQQADYLRKLIRVFQIHNEIRLLAITRKLKISDEELSIVLDSQRKKIGEEKWKEVENELNEIGNY